MRLCSPATGDPNHANHVYDFLMQKQPSHWQCRSAIAKPNGRTCSISSCLSLQQACSVASAPSMVHVVQHTPHCPARYWIRGEKAGRNPGFQMVNQQRLEQGMNLYDCSANPEFQKTIKINMIRTWEPLDFAGSQRGPASPTDFKGYRSPNNNTGSADAAPVGAQSFILDPSLVCPYNA